MAQFNPPILFHRMAPLTLGVCLFVLQATRAAVEVHPGKVIYDSLCLDCHGDRGQGVEGKYDEPLVGDRSLEALARKIDKTMPEDDEGACVGEDAKLVAAYIYDAFYSPVAQARVNPPEKDLARLTIPQFRNSVMDLIGRFHNGPGFDRPVGSEHGIKGFYRGFEPPPPDEKKPEVTLPEETKLAELRAAKADDKAIAAARNALQKAIDRRRREEREEADRKLKNRKRFTFERVDPQVAFHFGADSPEKGKMIPEEFQLRWDGCVIAPETGLYEFSVKTENGFRLWINDSEKAFIDGWVSAGPTVREEKKSIYLVGGRAYRLMLDHFKFKEQSASIELWWTPPHGLKEIIPAHHLRNDRPQTRLIVNTTFPADDRSVGYERGTTISKAWDQAVTDAAVTTAEYVEANLDQLAGTKDGAPDRTEKLRRFAEEFVQTAFARPLTPEQKALFVDAHFASAKSLEVAVKRVALLTLKSPQFLYPALREEGRTDGFAVASRLALALWDSIPDRALMKAVADGKFSTRDEVRAYAERMVRDERTKAKLHDFFHHWLDLEHAEGTSKDPKAFPGFNTEVIADLRESLLRFIDSVVWSETSDYRELLKADYLLLNERLGKFYGRNVKGDEFQRVAFDPKQRAGVVTHPYLLASLAYSRQTSPIHRGVFLTRNIVGMALKPPKMAVTFDESHFDPKLTMREKITELTRNNACMSCHSVINPLGFSLENFDAIGRWRTKDNNKPVNPVGEFSDDEGQKVRLSGPRDIVNYVADNPSGHRAFIRHLFHHTVKQQVPAYGPKVMDDLQRQFAASGCHIQKLLLEIALTAALDGVAADGKIAQN
jgi:mono/diheme cytochrome c family protein